MFGKFPTELMAELSKDQTARIRGGRKAQQDGHGYNTYTNGVKTLLLCLSMNDVCGNAFALGCQLFYEYCR